MFPKGNSFVWYGQEGKTYLFWEGVIEELSDCIHIHSEADCYAIVFESSVAELIFELWIIVYPIVRFTNSGKLLQILYRLYIVFNVKILN